MAHRYSSAGAAGLLLAGLMIGSPACSRPTTAPSPIAGPAAPAAQTVALTVRVQERTTERPIPGAVILHDGTRHYTDASGQSIVNVMPRQETTIEVSAAGYEPMVASAVLANDERWTFYLAVEKTDVP